MKLQHRSARVKFESSNCRACGMNLGLPEDTFIVRKSSTTGGKWAAIKLWETWDSDDDLMHHDCAGRVAREKQEAEDETDITGLRLLDLTLTQRNKVNELKKIHLFATFGECLDMLKKHGWDVKRASKGFEDAAREVIAKKPVFELAEEPAKEQIDGPAHYGGKENPYEAIKVIRAWGLGFNLGNLVKYVARAGKKPGESTLKDLKKARWYLDDEIKHLEAQHGSSEQAREGQS